MKDADHVVDKFLASLLCQNGEHTIITQEKNIAGEGESYKESDVLFMPSKMYEVPLVSVTERVPLYMLVFSQLTIHGCYCSVSSTSNSYFHSPLDNS